MSLHLFKLAELQTGETELKIGLQHRIDKAAEVVTLVAIFLLNKIIRSERGQSPSAGGMVVSIIVLRS
jgi:hypothetical protein